MVSMYKVYNWWYDLNEQEQYNLILNWYPEAIEEDTDIDKFFGDMPDREQLEIYEKEIKR